MQSLGSRLYLFTSRSVPLHLQIMNHAAEFGSSQAGTAIMSTMCFCFLLGAGSGSGSSMNSFGGLAKSSTFLKASIYTKVSCETTKTGFPSCSSSLHRQVSKRTLNKLSTNTGSYTSGRHQMELSIEDFEVRLLSRMMAARDMTKVLHLIFRLVCSCVLRLNKRLLIN